MRRQKWLPLLPILVAFWVLGVLYARATPVFEASDELWHFGLVDYIADHWQLPVQDPNVETLYRQEGSQPPLYYVLSALLVSGINRDDYESFANDPNPHAQVGVPGFVGNKNILLHAEPIPPLQGAALAVYVLRGFGLVLAAVTIFAVYAAALQVSSPSYAALAAAITAFNPMFLFISASVNNDNLVTMFVSLVIWQTVVMGWHGFKPWRSVFIAVGVALAALSKLSGLVLVPVVLFAAGYIAYRQQDQRGFNVLFAVSLVTGLALSGWWYVRNIILYGELFGTEMMAAVAGPRLEPFTPLTIYREAWGFFISYWALFGGVNILTFEWFYYLALVLSGLALVGVVLGMRKALPYIIRDLQEYGRVFAVTDLLNMYWFYAAAVYALLMLLGLFGVITWTAQTYASQGRLLFPFIIGISGLGAMGLQYFVRKRKWALTLGMAGGMGTMALVVPFTNIQPAYAPPAIVEALPETATPLYARWGEIELLGYEMPDERYRADQHMPVTLYWRAIEQSDNDLSAFLWVLDWRGQLVGKVDTYPGGGTLRTTTWEPGVIYQDVYGVILEERYPFGVRVPSTDLSLQVGWWDRPSETYLLAVDAEAQPLRRVVADDAGAYVADLVLENGRVRQNFRRVPRGLIYDLPNTNDTIQLIGMRQDTPTSLELVWRANRDIAGDYRVFAHMLDRRTGDIFAQSDRPPNLSTSYWRRGDLVITEHTFTDLMQPGHYSISVGWYEPESGVRLDLRRDEDNAHLLTRFSFP